MFCGDGRFASGRTPEEIRHHLGGRGMIPPIQQPLWLAVADNSPEVVDAALARSARAARPESYFLALFDEDGSPKPEPDWMRARAPANETYEERITRLYGPPEDEEEEQAS